MWGARHDIGALLNRTIAPNTTWPTDGTASAAIYHEVPIRHVSAAGDVSYRISGGDVSAEELREIERHHRVP